MCFWKSLPSPFTLKRYYALGWQDGLGQRFLPQRDCWLACVDPSNTHGDGRRTNPRKLFPDLHTVPQQSAPPYHAHAHISRLVISWEEFTVFKIFNEFLCFRVSIKYSKNNNFKNITPYQAQNILYYNTYNYIICILYIIYKTYIVYHI